MVVRKWKVPSFWPKPEPSVGIGRTSTRFFDTTELSIPCCILVHRKISNRYKPSRFFAKDPCKKRGPNKSFAANMMKEKIYLHQWYCKYNCLCIEMCVHIRFTHTSDTTIHTSMSMCVYVRLCIYIYIYLYVYLCIYIYTYIHMWYINTHSSIRPWPFTIFWLRPSPGTVTMPVCSNNSKHQRPAKNRNFRRCFLVYILSIKPPCWSFMRYWTPLKGKLSK